MTVFIRDSSLKIFGFVCDFRCPKAHKKLLAWQEEERTFHTSAFLHTDEYVPF